MVDQRLRSLAEKKAGSPSAEWFCTVMMRPATEATEQTMMIQKIAQWRWAHQFGSSAGQVSLVAGVVLTGRLSSSRRFVVKVWVGEV